MSINDNILSIHGIFIGEHKPRYSVTILGIEGHRFKSCHLESKSKLTKYMKINRHLSPHLTIYKPQLTSSFSIFHKKFGAFLGAAVR